MTLESLVQSYGYAPLFMGSFFSWASPPVIAGGMAASGLLDMRSVVVVSALGAWIGHQTLYGVARRFQEPLLRRLPPLEGGAERVADLYDRFGGPFLLVHRFVWGLRTVAPFGLAFSRTPRRRFALTDAAGALLWAMTLALFGRALWGLADLALAGLG